MSFLDLGELRLPGWVGPTFFTPLAPVALAELAPERNGEGTVVGCIRDEAMTYAAFCVTGDGLVLIDLVKPFMKRFVNSSEAQFMECVKIFFAAWPEVDAVRAQLEAVDAKAFQDDDCFWPVWLEEAS